MTKIIPTVADRIRLTERPTRQPVVMRQEWRDLLFLHWTVDADAVQTLLPAGLTVDTFGGAAYIGLVPFGMRNVRPVGCPAVPGLSHFLEINVRTYACDETGTPGVWFFSLDAANPIAVAIARTLFHLPYFHAAMRQTQHGKRTEYVSVRRHRGAKNAESVLTYTPQGESRTAAPGTLDHFLCERYLLYSENGGRLFAGRVYHTAYPLQSAALHDLSDTLVAAAGFSDIANETPAHVAFAAGVSVEVFPLVPLNAR